jgi:hypothetical protein
LEENVLVPSFSKRAGVTSIFCCFCPFGGECFRVLLLQKSRSYINILLFLPLWRRVFSFPPPPKEQDETKVLSSKRAKTAEY